MKKNIFILFLIPLILGISNVYADDILNEKLFEAIEDNNLNLVKELVAKGAEINKVHILWGTPLFYASREGHLDIVKYLIEKGADVVKANNYGQTPLFISVFKNNTDVAKYLIQKGADINEAQQFGKTPLHNAVAKDNLVLVKLLVEKGADMNIKDQLNKTPLYYTRFSPQIAKYLISKGANRAALVDVVYYHWWYCDNYNTNCINKMKITFENNSFKKVTSITFMLTIKEIDNNENETTLYRKKHTVSVDLDDGEVGDSNVFYLSNEVGSKYDFDDKDRHRFVVEILSIR